MIFFFICSLGSATWNIMSKSRKKFRSSQRSSRRWYLNRGSFCVHIPLKYRVFHKGVPEVLELLNSVTKFHKKIMFGMSESIFWLLKMRASKIVQFGNPLPNASRKSFYLTRILFRWNRDFVHSPKRNCHCHNASTTDRQ